MAFDIDPDAVNAELVISLSINIQDVETKLYLQRLHKAAMAGDWKTAREIFRRDQNLKTATVNSTGMTALHVACRCGRSNFVKKFVGMLDSRNRLIMKGDQQGRTVLHYAASAVSVDAVKALVAVEPALPNVQDGDGYTPLYYAAKWRHPSMAKEMVEYLHGLTDHDVYISDFIRASNLIVAITASGCYGVALNNVQRNAKLAIASNESGWSILHVIASAANKPSSTSRSWVMNIVCQRHEQSDEDGRNWTELIHFVCKELQNMSHADALHHFLSSAGSLDPILHVAAKNGVYELVQISLVYFPELISYAAGDDRKLLFHMAIEYRQEEIFNYILELVGRNIETYDEINDGGLENILHLAAKLAPVQQRLSVPGPAFQMQKELQWFKAVEELVYSLKKVGKNEMGMTPVECFYKEHEDLIKDAKEWMKDTSNSCMVVAALVATVAFASMITVPGGTNDSTGLPVFSKRVQFVIFSVSNALSMISSAISLLVFLSIQTSRYTEQDFMVSLPNNLLIGLFSLFVAVAAMMIAFALAVAMLQLHTGINWAYIPITLVACIPAFIFTKLQAPLLIQTLNYRRLPLLLPLQEEGDN